LPDQTPAEERYKYIGFDVFPKKSKPIFDSPEDEKKHLEKVHNRKLGLFSLEREHSLIEVPILNAFDKSLVLSLSIAVLLCLFVFPVANAYVKGVGEVSYSGLQLLLNFQKFSYYLAFSAPQVMAATALTLAFIVIGGIVALIQLVTVLTVWKVPNPRRLEKANRLGVFPVLLLLAALIASLFSVPTPVWSLLGVEELGKNYNIITFISLSSWGLWLMLAGLIMNSSVVAK
jgi:hypothetical protein